MMLTRLDRRSVSLSWLLALCGLAVVVGCDAAANNSPAGAPATASPTVPPPPPGASVVPPPPPGSAAATGLQAPVGSPTGKLKRVPEDSAAVVYTPDGRSADDEVVAPWLLGMAKRRTTPGDNATHARQTAGSTIGGLAHQIVDSRPTNIQGVEAYEFLTATTPGPPNDKTPLSVYFCILYPNPDTYIVIRGSAMKSVEAEWLPEFRALAHSWPVNP